MGLREAFYAKPLHAAFLIGIGMFHIHLTRTTKKNQKITKAIYVLYDKSLSGKPLTEQDIQYVEDNHASHQAYYIEIRRQLQTHLRKCQYSILHSAKYDGKKRHVQQLLQNMLCVFLWNPREDQQHAAQFETVETVVRLYMNHHNNDTPLTTEDVTYVEDHREIVASYYDYLVRRLRQFEVRYTSDPTQEDIILTMRESVHNLHPVSVWNPRYEWQNTSFSLELSTKDSAHCNTLHTLLPYVTDVANVTDGAEVTNVLDVPDASYEHIRWHNQRYRTSEMCTCGICITSGKDVCKFYLFKTEYARSVFVKNTLPTILKGSTEYATFRLPCMMRQITHNKTTHEQIYAPRGSRTVDEPVVEPRTRITSTTKTTNTAHNAQTAKSRPRASTSTSSRSSRAASSRKKTVRKKTVRNKKASRG